jgi:hypothetical protein
MFLLHRQEEPCGSDGRFLVGKKGWTCGGRGRCSRSKIGNGVIQRHLSTLHDDFPSFVTSAVGFGHGWEDNERLPNKVPLGMEIEPISIEGWKEQT